MTRPVLDVPLPIAAAHRGSRLLWPENTMAAFQGAVDLGLLWLETDLHVTRDGVIVTFHDDTLRRTTGSEGTVAEMDWADLEGVDAGYRHGRYQGYPFRGKGIGIPRLDEVLRSFPDVRLIVDLKQDGIEEAVASALRRWAAEDRVIVGSFSDDRLDRFRRVAGGRVATSAGQAEAYRVWRAARSGGAPALPIDALQVPRTWRGLPVVRRRFVEVVHSAGWQVHVWTVNRPRAMHDLLDIGVDGLISDRPDLLRAVLEERGTWTGRP